MDSISCSNYSTNVISPYILINYHNIDGSNSLFEYYKMINLMFIFINRFEIHKEINFEYFKIKF